MQERVARHLAMVVFLIDDDPELAHQHALSASRRAGRIPVARETLAITAYRTGDFALALRELRTYRRLSGLDGHVAIMVDSERGLGRPDKALETGLAVDASALDTDQRVHLAIAMSGARLDLGQTQQALFELEIPELNPTKAFSWSPDLFSAYSAVLEDLGRSEEAAKWLEHANHAARALQAHHGSQDELEVFEVYESEPEGFESRAEQLDSADDRGTDHEGEREEFSADASDGMSADADSARVDDATAEAEPIAVGADVEAEAEAEAETETEPSVSPIDAARAEEAHLPEDMSIEDEVDELLAAAGIGALDSDDSDDDADRKN